MSKRLPPSTKPLKPTLMQNKPNVVTELTLRVANLEQENSIIKLNYESVMKRCHSLEATQNELMHRIEEMKEMLERLAVENSVPVSEVLPTFSIEELPKMPATNQNAQRKSSNKEISLLDMPLEVAILVFEKMNLLHLLTARKVCRSLRTAVDKYGIAFDRVCFGMKDDHIIFCQNSYENIITYTDAAGGTTVTLHDGQKKRIEGENFVEIAAKGLKIVWKNVSSINVANFTRNRYDLFQYFINLLKPEECIPVKELTFMHISINDAITIMPYFDSQTLQSIELENTRPIDNLEQIAKLDQWKNAKKLVITLSDNMSSEQIDYVFHFEEFYTFMDKLFIQNAVKVRDDLMKRSKFKKFVIWSKIENPIEVAKLFKPDYAGGDAYKFEYSNDNHKFFIDCRPWIGDVYTFNVTKL